ncbi:branched-chain amino acid ABC transporter permease [Nocardioides humi]|uniref:Branched-chain amino acid ABC transporter permease n=1 Tax=Nocardioides humi TaxID=449461 RepID=A0ABN2B539_9ACTN|nr:branched-chain amino acid ABC transporter permease [Nocardioides humi]
MGLIVELLFNGVIAGCVYLLFTTGFTLLYGTFKIVNLAQGAILVVGGFVGIYFDNTLDAPLIVSILGAGVAAGILTVVMDVLVVRPADRAHGGGQVVGSDFAPLVVTLAFGTVVLGLLVNRVGHEPYAFNNDGWFTAPAFGFVSRIDIVLLAVTAAFGLLLYWAINRTSAGAKVRAVAEDRSMAAAVGVRPGVVSAWTFFAAGAFTGVAGVLIGVKYSNINVSIWESYLIIGFVIATVGGLGSVLGTAVASFVMGIVFQVAGSFYSQPVVNIIVYGLLFVTLFLRPSGLFGQRSYTQGVTRT